MIIGIMKTFLLTICFLSVQTGMVAIAQDKEQTPVYLDDTQPIEVRVQDLSLIHISCRMAIRLQCLLKK